MKKVCVCTLVILALIGLRMPSASALPPINLAWKAKYVEGNSNAAFVEAAKTANCKVCHGEDKKVRNDYGKAVGKFLTKAKITDMKKAGDEEGTKKYILEGLQKAESEKSSSGKTYGDLIKAGQLPGG